MVTRPTFRRLINNTAGKSGAVGKPTESATLTDKINIITVTIITPSVLINYRNLRLIKIL